MWTKVMRNKEPKIKEKKIYQLKITPLKKVGRKRKERLENWWSETIVFNDIWEKRLHICEYCNWPVRNHLWFIVKTPEPANFAHKLSKFLYPACRLIPENIALVCFDCHSKLDKKRDLIEKRKFYLQLCDIYPNILDNKL